ncbi:MAG: LysE family translocator [Pseudomonadota bacterium]
MTLDILIPLLGFALAGVITPGPNNVMLVASGANFGYRRSLPHMFGVGLGLPFMVIPVGLGVMQLFEAWPPLRTVLQIACFLYLLWLAWKIAHAAAPKDAATTGKPLSFLQASAFQWVNPKAWTMALGAITLYAPGREFSAVLWVAAAYAAMAVISTNTWVLAGQKLRQWLENERRLKTFNRTMAALLVVSMVPALLG